MFRWLKFYHHARRTLDPTLPRFRTLDQVGRALGVSRDMLERHVAAGDLEVRQGRWGEHGRLVMLIDEESLARLARLRATRFNYVQAAEYLGVYYGAVADLVEGGIIPGVRQGESPQSPWLFHKVAIDDALRAVMGHLPMRRDEGRAGASVLTLSDALASLRSTGIGLSETLRAIQQGDLAACRHRESVRLSDLRFDVAAVDAYRALHAPREGQERYTSAEVCRVLRYTQVTLRLWAEAGLLTPLDASHPRGDADDAVATTAATLSCRHRSTCWLAARTASTGTSEWRMIAPGLSRISPEHKAARQRATGQARSAGTCP